MIKRSNGIQDAGVPLVVDPFTRKVTVPVTERVIGVVGDHCSEQVTFSLVRNIDNHDMTTCTESYVSWRNVDGEEGTDELAITEVTEDRILFGWTVRNAVTTAKGLVSFSLHFECWDAAGKLVYKWGTHTCSECEILDAINTKMGGFAAIYIDGETLVFADYTPVRAETLELSSGIIPEGTIELTKAGTHDVGRYAYADVKAVFETPSITVADGKIKAEANGLTAEEGLETPSITTSEGKVTAEANGLSKVEYIDTAALMHRTPVLITHRGGGSVTYQDIEYSTNRITEKTLQFTDQTDNPYELNLITGSRAYFKPSVGQIEELSVDGVQITDEIRFVNDDVRYKVMTVPTVEDSRTVIIKTY